MPAARVIARVGRREEIEMISWSALALVLPAVLIASLDWRKGLFAMVIVAFLQDPARKLELDRPVYFTLLAGIVFAVAYLRGQLNTRFTPAQLPGWKHFMRTPFTLLLLLLVAQAAQALVVYGNPVIVGIGALSYLAPLPALLAGYHFALKRGRSGIEAWLTWYLIAALIVTPSILLEYAGFDSQVLGDVGEGFQLYAKDAVLTAHSGLFRASEIAAWHTATAVCVILLLSSMRRIAIKRMVLVIGIVVGLLAIGILTGRRKIFVEIAIFISIYVSLLALFGKGGTRLAVGAILGGVLSYLLVIWVVDEQVNIVAGSGTAGFQRYAERSATVQYGLVDRIFGLGLEPIDWAIDRFGWFGGGLGVASQGAQHFGGGAGVFGGAGEGGLGKITAELGVPGLLIMLWFGLAGVRYGWHVLTFVSARSTAVARLAYGLAAFLVANLAVFFVATQLFGDLFVLLILGLVAGFFVATPVLAQRELAQRKTAGERAPAMRPMLVANAPLAQRVEHP
jgi:ABC-type multidrug transport system fused ATPase/permease subunit